MTPAAIVGMVGRSESRQLARIAEAGDHERVNDASNPLPSGVVTLLMTDVEGSTQAWQADPHDMAASVSRHYEILDAGIAAYNGRRPEEQGEGDSVVAGFGDHIDAVAAALEIQLSLRSELPDLPVRMALHTGEALLRNEKNYAGLTIITCARIRNCGYGGQILMSDETRRPSRWATADRPRSRTLAAVCA